MESSLRRTLVLIECILNKENAGITIQKALKGRHLLAMGEAYRKKRMMDVRSPERAQQYFTNTTSLSEGRQR